MKKVFLICALAVAGMAFANEKVSLSEVQKAQQVQKVQEWASDSHYREVEASFNWQDQATLLQERKAHLETLASEYATADVYYAPGSFHLGVFDGLISYNVGMILFPYLDSVVYQNYYGATNWLVNGKLKKENSKTYTTEYGINGLYYVPSTADHTITISGTEYNIKGTSYGNGCDNAYVGSAVQKQFFSATRKANMTLCAMECDTLVDSSDFWRISANSKWTGFESDQKYLNGTGMRLDSANGPSADTLGVLVDNRGFMKIDKILFPIYNGDQQDKVFPDENAELRIALFPLTDRGINFNDTIAATTASKKDFTNGGTGYEWIGTLGVKFYAIDALGEKTQVPVYVDGPFYLQVTNFNESGCDFGFFSDFNNPFTGTTVYQHDGKFSFRASNTGGGKYGQNLGITFDAYYPTLLNDTTEFTLNADVAGGIAYYGEDPTDNQVVLYANDSTDGWKIKKSKGADWLSYEITPDYYTDYGVILVQFSCTELPAGVTGRKATVTFDNDGAKLEFTIKQGEDSPTAIIKVNKVNDGKLYNVLGMEVDENYKGVVIRNGEKFLQ